MKKILPPKLLRCVLLLAIAITGVSCAGPHFVSKEITTAQITSVARFEPFSDIGYIESRNEILPSDSLTLIAQDLFLSTLAKFETRLPPGPALEYAGPATREVMMEEILHMLSFTGNKKSLNEATTLPLLNDMITASGNRFGLLMFQTGFSRKKGNYGKEVAKGVGLGILTAIATMGYGSAYYTPTKSNSTIHVFIIDAEKGNIAMYDKVTGEVEPCNPEVVAKQVEKLVGKAFVKITPTTK
jgi:hypothetical protein